jgi:hypothetical protein
MGKGDGHCAGVYERLTVRRVQVLRLLADGHTETEIARALQIELTTAHSPVDELREITGQPSGRALGGWWREYRHDWVRWIAEQAGFELPPIDRPP